MPDQESRRTKKVIVRVEPNLKFALEQLARRDGRTLSNFLRKLGEQRVHDEEVTHA
jgi:predicted DNA-binding protein